MARRYTVIFIDLKGSSEQPALRDALQERLVQLEANLNARFHSLLVLPFSVVWGDELKGVLSDLSASWQVFVEAASYLQDTPFYLSVGYGTIDTPRALTQSTDINRADGVAFKAARNGLETLKEDEPGACRLRYEIAMNPDATRAINAFITIIDDVIHHLTPAQRREFAAVSPLVTVPDSKRRSVSRQSSWETLQRARHDAYQAAVEGLGALLRMIESAPEPTSEAGVMR